MIFEKIKKNFTEYFILLIGIVLRLFFSLNATPTHFQHDVINLPYGHFDYAFHFFRTSSLPTTIEYEFNQPPLNAILQSAFMKFVQIFNEVPRSIRVSYDEFMDTLTPAMKTSKNLLKYLLTLYSYNKILTAIYSIITLIIIYKIFKILFNYDDEKTNTSGNVESSYIGATNNINISNANSKVGNKINYVNKINIDTTKHNKSKNSFIKNKLKLLPLIIISIYPGMIMSATQYGNDALAYMFFFLSIYIFILWFDTHCKVIPNNENKISENEINENRINENRINESKINENKIHKKSIIYIVMLALSIGLGMMSKIQMGFIAFALFPLMLYAFYREKNKKSMMLEFIIFAVIVFPLGMWYPIRSKILFGVPLGFVGEIAKGTRLEIDTNVYSIVDRFLTFPISRLFDSEVGIYHSMVEYNAWIDLIKTSTFDEFNFSKCGNEYFNTFIYVLNIIFHITTFIMAVVLLIKNVFHTINILNTKRNIRLNDLKLKVSKSIDAKNSNLKSNNYENSNKDALQNIESCAIRKNLILYLGLSLYIIAIFIYVLFNVMHPYSCNTNYRYILFITFAESLIVVSSY